MRTHKKLNTTENTVKLKNITSNTFNKFIIYTQFLLLNLQTDFLF